MGAIFFFFLKKEKEKYHYVNCGQSTKVPTKVHVVLVLGILCLFSLIVKNHNET